MKICLSLIAMFTYIVLADDCTVTPKADDFGLARCHDVILEQGKKCCHIVIRNWSGNIVYECLPVTDTEQGHRERIKYLEGWGTDITVTCYPNIVITSDSISRDDTSSDGSLSESASSSNTFVVSFIIVLSFLIF